MPAAALLLIALLQSPPNSAKAYGLNAQRGVLTASGTAFVHGARQTFRFSFDRSFRYRLDVGGPIPETDGFDGQTAWTDGPSRVPHEAFNQERDAGLAVAWAMSGEWADRKAPLEITPWPNSTDLALRPRSGVSALRATIDPATGYLATLSYDSLSGDQVWHFGGFRSFAGRTLPTRIVLHSDAQDEVYEVQSVTASKESDGFHMPPPDPGSYDASVSPIVPIKRVGGYVFVRPTVNGQDLGWFFLDSGADVCCIDPQAAAQAKMPKVGSETAAGAVAVSRMDLYHADTLRVGPRTFRNPVMLALDLQGISKAIGFKVAGVCGYDLLARCVVDIDPSRDTIGLYAPDSAPAVPDVHWQPIRFNGNTPVIDAAFAPDHTGGFQLDTGSDSTVDFYSPTVFAYHLDQTPGVVKAKTLGAGGGAESLEGHIEWFDLGGARMDKPKVGFQLAKTGAFANKYLCGNIGMGFMAKFRVIFDYPHRRVGFIRAAN